MAHNAKNTVSMNVNGTIIEFPESKNIENFQPNDNEKVKVEEYATMLQDFASGKTTFFAEQTETAVSSEENCRYIAANLQVIGFSAKLIKLKMNKELNDGKKGKTFFVMPNRLKQRLGIPVAQHSKTTKEEKAEKDEQEKKEYVKNFFLNATDEEIETQLAARKKHQETRRDEEIETLEAEIKKQQERLETLRKLKK